MKKIAWRRFMELRIRKVDSTGTITTVASYPSVLRTVHIPLMTPEDCRENSFGTREVVHERTLCAGVEGKGIWSGDSGGPLVVSLPDGDWGQVGVTSMGGRARAGYPGVFTRTSSIYDWIHEHIDERAPLLEEIRSLLRLG